MPSRYILYIMHFITYPLTYLEPYHTACIYTIFNIVTWGRCAMLTVITSTIWGDEQKTLATLHAHPRNLYTHVFTPVVIHCHTIFTDTMCTLATQPCIHTMFIQTISNCSLHPHTYTALTHQAVGARSFTVQSGFIACDLMVILLAAIASFPIPWCPVVK